MSDYSTASINALAGALLGLTVLTGGLRLWARKFHGVSYGIDDGLMVVALVTFIGIAGIVFEYVRIGGIGVSTLPISEQLAKATTPEAAKLQVALTFLTIFCLGCSKSSICFLYQRIFCIHGSNPVFNRIVLGSIITILLWMIACLILFSQVCHNHWYALWETEYLEQYCSDLTEYLYAICIMDVIFDVWVLSLPIGPVFALHMTPAKKVSVLGIFLLAAVALGASIARLVIYTEVYRVGIGNIAAGATERFTSRVYFYFLLESGISVIATNLPLTGPLLVRSNLHAITRLARSVSSLASKHSGQSIRPENSTGQQSPANELSKGSRTNVANDQYRLEDLPPRTRADYKNQAQWGDISPVADGDKLV